MCYFKKKEDAVSSTSKLKCVRPRREVSVSSSSCNPCPAHRTRPCRIIIMPPSRRVGQNGKRQASALLLYNLPAPRTQQCVTSFSTSQCGFFHCCTTSTAVWPVIYSWNSIKINKTNIGIFIGFYWVRFNELSGKCVEFSTDGAEVAFNFRMRRGSEWCVDVAKWLKRQLIASKSGCFRVKRT